MTTQPVERTDLGTDLFEALDDRPRIAHAYCPVCQPMGVVGAIITAKCGHSETEDGRPAGYRWPEGAQRCVVCVELVGSNCPRCGA